MCKCVSVCLCVLVCACVCLTKVEHQISVTDFRSLKQVPDGNRFITYCLFPDSIASVKIRYSGSQKRSVQLSIGKSLFNRQCRVNIGRLLSRFGGGGHDGAGGCTLDAKTAPADIDKILDVLYANPKETKDN